MATQEKPTGDELTDLVSEAKNMLARNLDRQGRYRVRFTPDEAPQHCAAFIKLSRAGFYDGTIFHRVEPGFVIQGGDPTGTGTGGPGYHLDAEFSKLPHNAGTVAMARASDPNSAGCQFYICLGDAPFLNNKYTVFGQVIEGQSVVEKIAVGDVMNAVTIEPR